MKCNEYQEKMWDAEFGLLDETERKALDEHLALCPDCRAEREAVKEKAARLNKWRDAPVPEGLAERTIARVREERKRAEVPGGRVGNGAGDRAGDGADAGSGSEADAGAEMDEAAAAGGRVIRPVEPRWAWLGGGVFWRAAAAALLMIVFVVGGRGIHLFTRHASPLEVTVVGQPELAPGLPAAFRVHMRDGRTAEPAAGGTVRARLVHGREVVWASERITAGDDGFAQVDLRLPEDAPQGEYELQVTADTELGADETVWPVRVERAFRILVTTDKPLYQPGQVIHIRALSLAAADMRPAAGAPAVLEVLDAKGNKVFKKPAETSAFGIISGDFRLADEVNTGTYTILATIGGTTSEKAVTVERYRLPRFRIDVTPDRSFYAPGDILSADIRAGYTFGKPVTGARVALTASTFVERFHPFATVNGTTDAEGFFRLDLALPDHFVGQELKKGDATVKLDVTVTDAAGHTREKSLDLTVTERPIRIEIFPESGTLVQNVPNRVYIVTAYPDGRPARTKLTIGRTGQVTRTSEMGIAVVELTPASPEMQLTVTAEDDRGARASVTRALRIGREADAFLLRTDRAVYRVGDTAALEVISGAPRGRVFLDVVKDRTTLFMKGIDVEDGRGQLALDLPADLSGTLELHAYRIRADGNIVRDTKVIQVNRADDLRITADLDAETYRPGAKAVLSLAVSDERGDPARAALSLSAVDEAVFALQDMQPGLERVYFMLQEEILEPRYEIHCRAPVAASTVVQPPADTTPGQELEEAEVVLFSTAEGITEPVRHTGLTFEQKNAENRERRRGFLGRLAAGGAMLPMVLFWLVFACFAVYAVSLVFRGRRQGHRGKVSVECRRRAGRLFAWWLAGIYLPLIAVFMASVPGRHEGFWHGIVGEPSGAAYRALVTAAGAVLLFVIARQRRERISGFLLACTARIVLLLGLVILCRGVLEMTSEKTALACAAAALVLVLAPMIGAARRLRRMDEVRDRPVFRRLAAFVPFFYVLTLAALAALVAVEDAGVLDEGLTAGLILGSLLAVLLFPGLWYVSRDGAASGVGFGRWLWLMISRPVLSLVFPALLLMLIIVPAVRMRMPLGATLDEAAPQRALGFEGMGAPPPGAAPMAERMALGDQKLKAPGAVGAGWDKSDMDTEAAGEGGSLRAPARVRRYFPETLFWKPQVITDEQGRARLEIDLADSITTWRLAMSAVSPTGALGSGTAPIRVFQDFFVDIDFPVALTQNDEVSVPVAVFNYLDGPQTVRLEAEPADWYELLDGGTHTLRLLPGEVTARYITLRAKQPGTHALLVRAFGSEMADAVERTVRVEPDGREVVDTINGRLDGTMSHEVVIPEAAIDGASGLLVKIYPGAFSQVMEGMDGIFRMPFGCFEQTSSVTYPNILVLDYMRRTGQTRPEIEMQALEYINLGYQRLLSYEVDGGGFEWFGRPPAHIVLTAYGLMEFSDMARVFEVDPAIIERTAAWLADRQGGDGSWKPQEGGIAEGAINAFQGQQLRTTAYIAWALGESGLAADSVARAAAFIEAGWRSSDDPYTLALCANALLAAGEKKAAREILGRLVEMKVEGSANNASGDSVSSASAESGESTLVHWTSASAGVTHSRGSSMDVETTALTAYALLTAGAHTATAHKALEWLISVKDPHGTWYSTQATVHAMRALLLGAEGGGALEEDADISIIVNGEPAEELHITPETSDVYRLVSLKAHVRKGTNTVVIEPAGGAGLAYQVVATHYVPGKEKTAGPAEALEIGLRYDRTSLRADDILGCEVTVRCTSGGAVQMAIVDLGIPPGFEVLTDAFERLKQERTIERYSLTGRQVILYFREIGCGAPVKFRYEMKAKFPVKVKTPRSAVYEYYQPENRAEEEPVELVVL